MRGRSSRRRIFSSASVVWLVLGGLILLMLLTKRHETGDALKAIYRTVRERFEGGGQGQPSQQDTASSSEEEDEGGLVQEESREEETEGGSTTEAEEASSQEIRSVIRESVRRSEGGSTWKTESQSGERTAAPEGSRKGGEGPPIEGYDSLNVGQVTQKLLEWSVEEVEQLRDYEAQNRNRPSVVQRFERRLNAARENLKKGHKGEAEEGSEEEIGSLVRESVRRSAREE